MYEVRHNALIDHDSRLDQQVREVQADLKSCTDALDNKIDTKFSEVEDKKLSEKDRTYIRIGQIGGVLALLIAILSFVLQHVHLN